MISENDIQKLETIVRKAGKAIMEVYKEDDVSISIKEDNSPVTRADLLSNEIIKEGLSKSDIDFPYLSEEEYQEYATHFQEYKTLWLVDPLDGTKEFINRNGEFAICLALIHENKSVFGMIYAPYSDELFYALEDHGAFKIANGQRKKIHVSTFTENQNELRIAVSRSHKTEQLDQYIKQHYSGAKIIRRGSVLKMTDIAEGKIDVYPRIDNKTSEWDIAAGQIIVEEAGGEVVLIEDGSRMKYNKSKISNHPFIARARRI